MIMYVVIGGFWKYYAKLPSDGINVHLAVLASLNHTQKQYETDQNTDKLNVNKIWIVNTCVCKFNCKQELCVIDICLKLTFKKCLIFF